VGRPPKYSRRYHLTLEAAEADLLDAYALEQRRPVATVATRLLVQALRQATSSDGGELAVAQRQVGELQATNATLRRRLSAARRDGDEAEPPRWEWAIEDLLTDHGWWATWLPRLYELLGRQLRRYTGGRIDVVDDRGYADLMAFLFPPILDQAGRVVAEWKSLAYPHHAVRAGQAGRDRHPATEATPSSARQAVWEPVIRHVAEALCALEQTAQPGADAVLRIRTKDELATSWLRTLRRLTGADAADLPTDLT
jgi:hypothetical protein